MSAAAAQLSPGPHLDQLFEQARIATAAGSKSFYFASRFFPTELARNAHAVYWFCRTTDDLVDEAPSIEAGAKDLNSWEAELRYGLSGGAVSKPVLQLFLHVAGLCQIPAEYPLDLIAGCRMDLERQRYANWEEFRLFCYRVASCVGLMMCHVIGFLRPAEEARGKQHAVDLGLAMQLTNILRDVAADHTLGRIYFPQEDLDRFGVSEEDLAHSRVTSAFRELMRFEAARARQYYASAMPGIALLRPEGRFAVEIAARVYAAILREIERQDYNVFARRAVVSTPEKYWITGSALASSYWGRLTQ